eukprot:765390-Hanusia_phi.AAC.6
MALQDSVGRSRRRRKLPLLEQTGVARAGGKGRMLQRDNMPAGGDPVRYLSSEKLSGATEGRGRIGERRDKKEEGGDEGKEERREEGKEVGKEVGKEELSLIHISEPTRPY